MGVKRTAKAVSVIDIGSNYVRMGVYQRGKGGIQPLDTLEYPLRLGHEVFTTGRVSPGAMRQLVAILRGYTQVMKEYGVTEYRAIAATALREAENRAFVLDQIRVQNNLAVEVLEDGRESSLIYSALLRSPHRKEESLLGYVGTGSLGLAVWRQGAVEQSCSMTIGFLKLSEILRSQEDQTSRFYRVLEEYIDTYFQRVRLRLGEREASQILLAGRQLSSIAALCGAKEDKGDLVVTRDQIEEAYGRLKSLSAPVIARELDLPEEVAEQMVPMLAIYRKLLELFHARKLVAPPASLMDVLAGQMLVPAEKEAFESAERAGAVASARLLAEKEGADLRHAERVRETAVLFFNKLKKLHGISGKRLVLLECAALLHEAGTPANVRSAPLAAFDRIRQAYLYGLGEEETLLVAEIVRAAGLRAEAEEARALPEKQRLLVGKLAAILVLADALDCTKRGRISEVKVRLEEERLAVTASGREEPLLEKWAFQDAAGFFEAAFGIRPVLTYKNPLL